jgi:CBS domain-containing protein
VPNVTVRYFMTRTVVSVRPDTPLKEVARLLVEHGISGVPVVAADGSVLGVVSEGDLLEKERGSKVGSRQLMPHRGASADAASQARKRRATSAAEAMTSPALTIEAGRPVRDAAEMMISERKNRLPVVDRGALIGIVTRADLIRAFVRADSELADVVRSEVLLHVMYLDPSEFDVSVTEGVALIRGSVDRRSTAEILQRVTSMVPGIIGVVSELSWEVEDRHVE